MIRSLIRSSIKVRLLVVAIALVIVFLGVSQMHDAQLDAYPEFSPVYVEVQTEALGLSAAEVEQMITVPMEADLLNGVAWLKEIRSESIPGLSSIVMEFEPGTDVMRARQMVQERLTQAHGLPNVSQWPAMLQPLSSANRVLTVGLSSSALSHIEMSVQARWTIRPRLMGVEGVANISIWGQRKRQLQVLVDPQELKAKNVTLMQIVKTAGNALWVSPLSFLNASSPGTGGWIDTPNQRLTVMHKLPITTPEDLAKVIVDGEKIPLGSVAEVVEDHQPLIGDVLPGEEPGLLLMIEKFPWANTVEVTNRVEKAIDQLRPGLVGINFDTKIFRPATYLESARGNLEMVALIGAILLALALFIFLYNWQAGVISIFTIFLSVLVALYVFHLTGTPFNMMVIAGFVIAFAAVIDDSIINSENIIRRLRQYNQDSSEKSIVGTIVEATFEMRRPTLYATLIIILVVVPLFFLQGLTGSFLRPVANSYVLALVASMLVILTVIPALSMYLFAKSPLVRSTVERRESPFIVSMRNFYRKTLSPFTDKPVTAFIIVAVLLVLGAVLYPQLGQESVVPTLKENDLLIQCDSPPGTSIQAITRSMTLAANELRSVPGVLSVTGNIGRAILSDQIENVNSGEIWVSLKPDADYDLTNEKIQQVVDGYPSLNNSVMTFLREKTREALTGSEEDIIVRVYGHEIEGLKESAKIIKQALSDIEDISEIILEDQVEEATLQIMTNLTAAARYGIKPGDVRRAASILLSGLVVGSLFEEQKVFSVVVWGKPEIRHSISSVKDLLIDTPTGGHVRLGDVAEVKIVPSSNSIKREAVMRTFDIGLNVRGRDIVSVASDVDKRIKEMKFPLEYHAEVLGEFAAQQSAKKRFIGLLIAAIFGVYLLLQAAFGSWRLSAFIFLSLIAALFGGVIGAFVGGGVLSVGSFLGFITIFGIAARNSIVMISHYQYLEQYEGVSFGADLVKRGTEERMGAISMTTIATALVFLPMVIFGNIAGLEILLPMAVVVLFGLITAFLVNLFVVPALYLKFGGTFEPVFEEKEERKVYA